MSESKFNPRKQDVDSAKFNVNPCSVARSKQIFLSF